MNTPTSPSASYRPANSESLFGMALAQAFLGFVHGPLVEQLWEAGEVASAVYEDRYQEKRTNGRVYDLGVKKSLADDFARTSMASPDRARLDRSLGDWCTAKPFTAQAERRFAI